MKLIPRVMFGINGDGASHKRRTLKSILNGWVLKFVFGPGAGYVGGRAAFLAWRSGSLWWWREFRGDTPRSYPAPWRQGSFRIGPVEFGFTRNANLVPIASFDARPWAVKRSPWAAGDVTHAPSGN